jgi:hypothetical protein
LFIISLLSRDSTRLPDLLRVIRVFSSYAYSFCHDRTTRFNEPSAHRFSFHTVHLVNLESTLPIVYIHAPKTFHDMLQRFSPSGHSLLITLKSAKCSISTTVGPRLSKIWNPLSLLYISMLPEPCMMRCSGSHSVATPS